MAFLATVAQGIVLLYIQFLVGRKEDGSLGLQVQVKIADQLNRTREPRTVGHHEVTATLLLEVLQCCRKSLGAVGLAVAYSAKVGQRDGIVRDDYLLYFLYGAGQILIVVRVFGLSLQGQYGQSGYQRECNSFHCHVAFC